MTKVTVVTACYGDLDTPIDQPPQDIDVRWVCVTRRSRPSDTWEIVVEPRPHLSDRQAAKVPKFRPDRYADSDIVVWFDGSVALRRPDAVRRFVEPLDGGYDLALVPHPLWNDIASESRGAQEQGRHAGQRLEAQMRHYLADGGLRADVWATAVQARRVTPETSAFGDAVLLETLRWTVHDQLAVPYILDRSDLKVGRIDVGGHLLAGTPYLSLRVLNRPEDNE